MSVAIHISTVYNHSVDACLTIVYASPYVMKLVLKICHEGMPSKWVCIWLILAKTVFFIMIIDFFVNTFKIISKTMAY